MPKKNGNVWPRQWHHAHMLSKFVSTESDSNSLTQYYDSNSCVQPRPIHFGGIRRRPSPTASLGSSSPDEDAEEDWAAVFLG